jgi:hypothetical protein
MKLVDIANEIFVELEEPEDNSIPQIVYWLSSNIGKLNILLSTDIIIEDDYTLEINVSEKEIFKTLYHVNYLSKLVKSNLGAAAYDWSELVEGDSRVRRVSKNELAKNYYSMKKDLQTEVEDLVFYYKQNQCLPESYSAYTDILQYYRLA